MNDLLASIYEKIFNWDVYQGLLTMVYDNVDYFKFALELLIVPTIILIVFYKFWDPVKSPKSKWFLTLLIIALVSYMFTTSILYKNPEIAVHLGNEDSPDGHYFIVQMSLISTILSFIISLAFTFIIRLISNSNRKTPF